MQQRVRAKQETPTSTGIVIGHCPLNREQTEQESNPRGPPASAVDHPLASKHVTRRMHFATGGGREEGNDDN